MKKNEIKKFIETKQKEIEEIEGKICLLIKDLTVLKELNPYVCKTLSRVLGELCAIRCYQISMNNDSIVYALSKVCEHCSICGKRVGYGKIDLPSFDPYEEETYQEEFHHPNEAHLLSYDNIICKKHLKELREFTEDFQLIEKKVKK